MSTAGRGCRGREICFGSNEQAVIIYDVTDKADLSRYRDDDIVTVSSIDRGLFVLETDLDRRRR